MTGSEITKKTTGEKGKVSRERRMLIQLQRVTTAAGGDGYDANTSAEFNLGLTWTEGGRPSAG